MTLNVDHLRSRLEDYRATLARQRLRIQLEHSELDRRFQGLFAIYQGRMAEEFQREWASTSRWFEEYIAQSARMDLFLEARIEALKQV